MGLAKCGTVSIVLTCVIPQFSSKAVPHSSLAASPIPLFSRKSRFGLANCGTVPRLLRRTKPPSRIYNEATPRRLPSRATRLAIAGRYSCKKPLKATKQSSAVPQFLSSLCPRISFNRWFYSGLAIKRDGTCLAFTCVYPKPSRIPL